MKKNPQTYYATLGPKTPNRVTHLKADGRKAALCGRQPAPHSKGWDYEIVNGEDPYANSCKRCWERDAERTARESNAEAAAKERAESAKAAA